MSNRHELGNMVFNLEERKNLKEVNFTKSAVKEVLSYLKELYEIKNKEHEEDRRIADLEAKLAESEKSKEINIRERDKICLEMATEYNREIIQLKQQLAEKEKAIENYEKFTSVPLVEMTKMYEQDKIDYAVEKLEKVKEILLENLYDLYSKPSEIWDKYGDLYDVVVEGVVNGTIDNQIKQLKEGK